MESLKVAITLFLSRIHIFAGFTLVLALPFETCKNLFLQQYGIVDPDSINRLDMIIEPFLSTVLASCTIAYLSMVDKSFWGAARNGMRFWFFVFLTIIAYRVMVFAGLLLLIVPGLVVASAFCFAPVIVLQEKKSIYESFRISLGATRGRRLELLLGLILFTVIPLLAVVIIRLPIEVVGHWFVTSIIDALSDLLPVSAYVYLWVARNSTVPAPT